MVIRYSQLCAVREIINKYDIDGLLAFGAPSDEYYDLVDTIIETIKICDESHIRDILINMFDQEAKSSEGHNMLLYPAKEIYDIIKE